MNAEASCRPSKTDSIPPVLGNNYREGGSSLNPNMQMMRLSYASFAT